MLTNANPPQQILAAAMEDIVLQYTYPRIDAEVSKHRNHLLKAPFCVHPGTGRVCVPVNPQRVKDFDPERVPSVGQLLHELDMLSKEEITEGVELSWENTSLKPYVEMMEEHNRRILVAVRERKMMSEYSYCMH
jgi:DNA primase small subunit